MLEQVRDMTAFSAGRKPCRSRGREPRRMFIQNPFISHFHTNGLLRNFRPRPWTPCKPRHPTFRGRSAQIISLSRDYRVFEDPRGITPKLCRHFDGAERGGTVEERSRWTTLSFVFSCLFGVFSWRTVDRVLVSKVTKAT